jgi:hypothetical protein
MYAAKPSLLPAGRFGLGAEWQDNFGFTMSRSCAVCYFKARFENTRAVLARARENHASKLCTRCSQPVRIAARGRLPAEVAAWRAGWPRSAIDRAKERRHHDGIWFGTGAVLRSPWAARPRASCPRRRSGADAICARACARELQVASPRSSIEQQQAAPAYPAIS